MVVRDIQGNGGTARAARELSVQHRAMMVDHLSLIFLGYEIFMLLSCEMLYLITTEFDIRE